MYVTHQVRGRYVALTEPLREVIANENVKNRAMYAECIFDEQFIREARTRWFFVDYGAAPQSAGYYRIDVKAKNVIELKGYKYPDGLEWNEILEVRPSALLAVREKRLLALSIDSLRERGKIVLSGSYSDFAGAPVAYLINPEERPIVCAKDIKSTLRTGKGQGIVLILPDGKKRKIEVPEGTIVEVE